VLCLKDRVLVIAPLSEHEQQTGKEC